MTDLLGVIPHEAQIPNIELLKYIKPCTTLNDLVGISKREGIVTPNSPQLFVIDLLRLWYQQVLPTDPKYLQASIRQEQETANESIELPMKRVAHGGMEYKVYGVAHLQAIDKDAELVKQPESVDAMEEAIKAQIEQDQQEGRTSLAEAKFKEMFHLPYLIAKDLNDISIFAKNEDYSERVKAFMRTSEYLGLAKNQASPILTSADTDQNPQASRFANALIEFMKWQQAAEILIVRDMLRRRQTSIEIFPEFVNHFQLLEEELMKCRNIRDFTGCTRVLDRLSMPEPLDMEVSFLFHRSPNDPLYKYRDPVTDRSQFQAQRAIELMSLDSATKGSLYVGYAHVPQICWFLTHPEYDIRDSLTRAITSLAI